jgi:exonuclease VII small subunit
MQSQGRKGFKKTGEFSGLDDRVLMKRIADRMETLLHIIRGDLPNPLMEEKVRLEKAVEELEDAVEELEDDNRALQRALRLARERNRELVAVKERYEGLDELVSQINEVLNEIYLEPFQDLESAVEALIEEYDDLLEETDDEY